MAVLVATPCPSLWFDLQRTHRTYANPRMHLQSALVVVQVLCLAWPLRPIRATRRTRALLESELVLATWMSAIATARVSRKRFAHWAERGPRPHFVGHISAHRVSVSSIEAIATRLVWVIMVWRRSTTHMIVGMWLTASFIAEDSIAIATVERQRAEVLVASVEIALLAGRVLKDVGPRVDNRSERVETGRPMDQLCRNLHRNILSLIYSSGLAILY